MSKGRGVCGLDGREFQPNLLCGARRGSRGGKWRGWSWPTRGGLADTLEAGVGPSRARGRGRGTPPPGPTRAQDHPGEFLNWRNYKSTVHLVVFSYRLCSKTCNVESSAIFILSSSSSITLSALKDMVVGRLAQSRSQLLLSDGWNMTEHCTIAVFFFSLSHSSGPICERKICLILRPFRAFFDHAIIVAFDELFDQIHNYDQSTKFWPDILVYV